MAIGPLFRTHTYTAFLYPYFLIEAAVNGTNKTKSMRFIDREKPDIDNWQAQAQFWKSMCIVTQSGPVPFPKSKKLACRIPNLKYKT